MLIGVMGAIVTMLVVAGMILMTPRNTVSFPDGPAETSAASHDDPDDPRSATLGDDQRRRVTA
jgi:hypothetical protein